jgi:hypothetical protein
VQELRRLTMEQRSALLLLGHFLNEANWLRKLLAGAVLSIADGPDGQANFALVVQLATALAGKVHEGWKKVQSGSLARTIHTVAMPDDLKALCKDINKALAVPTIRSIRNSYSFHGPTPVRQPRCRRRSLPCAAGARMRPQPGEPCCRNTSISSAPAL